MEVWPENWTAWSLFCDMATQWRIGMGGATGLDYGPLFRLMDAQGLEGSEWRAVFDDIRVLESSSLTAMRTKLV